MYMYKSACASDIPETVQGVHHYKGRTHQINNPLRLIRGTRLYLILFTNHHWPGTEWIICTRDGQLTAVRPLSQHGHGEVVTTL